MGECAQGSPFWRVISMSLQCGKMQLTKIFYSSMVGRIWAPTNGDILETVTMVG